MAASAVGPGVGAGTTPRRWRNWLWCEGNLLEYDDDDNNDDDTAEDDDIIDMDMMGTYSISGAMQIR